MKHIHVCTECGNSVTCPASLESGNCEEAFSSTVEDLCQGCWEGQDYNHMQSFEKNDF